MSSKLVLGHPYHGAFYWLLTAEGWRSQNPKSAPQESYIYYQTLYGDAPQKVLDELVSICLLYDDIHLAPADSWLPKMPTKTTAVGPYYPDLGAFVDLHSERDFQELDRLEEVLLANLNVQHLLLGLPQLSHGQVLRTAIVQLRIREQTDGHLLASAHYLRLCDLIHSLVGELVPAPVSAPGHLAPALKTLFETASLRFSISNLDEYVALRSAKSVHEYSIAFREVLDSLPTGMDTEYTLYKAMVKAANSSDLTNHVSGGLSMSATLSGIASLGIPGISTIAGVAGLAADWASRVANQIAAKQKWWALAPEISTVLTRTRIEARFSALEKAKSVGDPEK